jgi:hypothetical protein
LTSTVIFPLAVLKSTLVVCCAKEKKERKRKKSSRIAYLL